MEPLPPRAALIDPARYDLALKRNWAWREVEKLAKKARHEAVRLKALENYIDRTDPKPREDTADPTRVVAVSVHLHAGDAPAANGHGAQPALPPSGIAVHLEGDHGGNGAGSGRVRDPR